MSAASFSPDSNSTSHSGRRIGAHISRRDSGCYSDSCSSEPYPYDAFYKDKPTPDYLNSQAIDQQISGWTIVQIGLRIISLFLSGMVAGCSIRGYLTGLILWLPLVIVIVLWEVAELLAFAVQRTHGLPRKAHVIVEFLIALGALAYTGLSVWEIFVFRGYRSIVEFAVVTGLCAVIS
ncbi:hypothetical protein PFICI_07388 [Pestalotiopsis fici W106-1]|uniref:Uncharacterized protein n=1 Tax=Pestalotiopsis fici (strain W106-1 / CGMCC3.15140) TaxID=1229662 RepID=W3X1G9_PESFW|nr:uncharacterized protein PFICI_07388 [Pestalotiopsis fici W106-1]ETS79859.1 hypothetical protein PFICI_07388 [Pestalotiopsis fici W106-1]